jgi:hypothetical protein
MAKAQIIRKLDEVLTVAARGNACQGGVPWESRYYVLTDADGTRYTWHGGNAEQVWLEVGEQVHIRASVADWITVNPQVAPAHRYSLRNVRVKA